MPIITSKKSLRGAGVPHFKNTSDKQTEQIPLPDSVTIPLLQHMGAPCVPIVSKGDMVCVGQKIGESVETFSVPVHASCSGEVTDVIDYQTVTGGQCKAVIIKTDGKQTIDSSIKPPVIDTKEQFIEAVKQSGLVGLGGAGFPTFIKFDYKDIDKVDKLVINAAECEPYITVDQRECLENTENIVLGVKLIKKFLGINEVYFGVEDNKPDVIFALDEAFPQDSSVFVVRLKSIYPQGAEKSIIYAATGITVTEGKLPADCGVIVANVSTIGFVGSYASTGMPLVSKRVTVDGNSVATPKNLCVPIGTSIQTLLDFCNVDNDYKKVLMGGPMMGLTVHDTKAPIVKNNNAITILTHVNTRATTACIRCSRCVGVCPMKLMPMRLEAAYDMQNVDMLKEYSAQLCINCGCCTFACPAKRHLAQKIQIGKTLLKKKI